MDWPTSVSDLLTSGFTVSKYLLVGWWNFNNVSTPNADYSGNGNDCTLTGTADVAGYSGRGRSFLLTTDYMDF